MAASKAYIIPTAYTDPTIYTASTVHTAYAACTVRIANAAYCNSLELELTELNMH